MSYQVLARKWRPQTFNQVIGQAHVLTALENALAQNRVHHAYLFSGTRGVGKTTIARLLAKSLNCEQGVTATPCGQCVHCQAIDQGRFVDLLEIDAASRTKVDDTRELLDNVQYKPAQGRYKVYLIDEVHMLSKHSFNALLKTLEEPPEYVKFLLATTDPQKLPITVLSRCLQFHLKAILPEQIESQLMAILQHEQAYFEQAAIKVIAKSADGSMRDALSLTDQALAFGAGRIEYEPVLKMLGTIDQAHLYYLLHFIASGNTTKVFEKITEFVELGADFSSLHQELANLCHEIALKQLQVNANITEKTPQQLLAERLTPEEVQLFYQIALQGYKDYSYAPNGKVAFEMTVMRLLAFKPANYIELDESLLQDNIEQVVNIAPQVDRSEIPVHASTVNIEDLATVNVPLQSIEQSQIAPVAEPIQSPVQQNNEIAVENTAPMTEPVNEQQALKPQLQQTVISQPDPVATNVTEQGQGTSASDYGQIQQVSQTEQVAITEPETQRLSEPRSISGSRNMLRSHRLKREALKKNPAVTESNSNETGQVTAEDNLAITHSTEVKQAGVSSEFKEPAAEKVQAPSIKPQVEVAEQTAFGQPLPPLDSYQEQEYLSSAYDFAAPPEHLEQIPVPAESATTAIQKEQTTSQPAEVASSDVNSVYTEDPSSIHSQQGEIANERAVTTQFVSADESKVEDAEIDIAAYVDDKINDAWFLAIKAMQLVGLEKLLAKNSCFGESDNKFVLSVDAKHQHLLNNQQICESVINKVQVYYGKQQPVQFIVSEDKQLKTPVALEQIVFQQYLTQAKIALQQDPVVNILLQDYSAKLYENSVVPL